MENAFHSTKQSSSWLSRQTITPVLWFVEWLFCLGKGGRRLLQQRRQQHTHDSIRPPLFFLARPTNAQLSFTDLFEWLSADDLDSIPLLSFCRVIQLIGTEDAHLIQVRAVARFQWSHEHRGA